MEKQQKNTDEQTEDVSIDKDVDIDETVEQDNQSTVEELNQQIEELQDKLLRQLAESENIRNRSNKRINEAQEYAIFSFAKDLVPVMDNFQRALQHIPDNLSSELKNMIDGIQMTQKQLDDVFKKHHLESIKPHPNDKFDYNMHHAISQIVTDEFAAGNIVDTMQIGYRIKDRLIRPATVAVAKSGE